MSSSPSARNGISVLLAFATLFLGFTFFTAQASALSPPAPKIGGNAAFVFKGKVAKTMLADGVKVRAIAPAKLKKGSRVVVPVRNASISQARSEVVLNGGIVFRKGKRSVRIDKLNVSSRTKRTVIGARIQTAAGKKRAPVRMTNVFRVGGKSSISRKGKTDILRFKGARLSLTKGVARTVRKALRLKKAPGGQIGSFSLTAKRTERPFNPGPCDINPAAPECVPDPCETDPTAEGCPVIDPYLAQCGVEATSKVVGSLPLAAPLPLLPDLKNVVGPDAIEWGFKQSFRNYAVNFASGSLNAVAPATLLADDPPAGPFKPVPAGFSFPLNGGYYAANTPESMTDDQAIVVGTGTALFCATGHGFRVAISNPTIVIDGENSRIVADVDTNLTGVWTPNQRVDLATLDLSGITPFYNKSGSEVSWSDIPATLTQAGGDAICGTGEQAACSYTAGTDLDPIDVAVKTPYDTSDFDSLANYVSTNLPFPMPDPTQGGCTLPGAAGGSAPAARTIDEHASFGGTTAAWKPNAGSAVPVPDLSGAIEVTGGGFDWGFRTSLRSSINGTGEFNPALGATASHTPYYGNGGETPVFPRPLVPGAGQMGGPGKFFTWPAATTAGRYDPTGAGKLVLRTAGRVGFCQTQSAQLYGTVLSNPTIVLDGNADSGRIQIDVATRYRLSWVRGTVDIATIDLTGVTPLTTEDSGTTTVAWTLPDAVSNVGPVELTADGESVVGMIAASYVEGLGLDGTTIRASFPTPAE